MDRLAQKSMIRIQRYATEEFDRLRRKPSQGFEDQRECLHGVKAHIDVMLASVDAAEEAAEQEPDPLPEPPPWWNFRRWF